MKKYAVPGIQNIYFCIIFLLVLVSGPQMLSGDSDLGRHLALGNYILENHVVPSRDVFSHTLPDQPRPPYEWLTQVLFALVYRLLHLDGIILMTAIVISVTFALLYKYANDRCGSPALVLATAFLASSSSSIHWLPRPHIFTFLFLAIWIERLEKLRKGETVRLFIFPLMMLFWANMHGGFVFGILAWGAYFAGWLWERIRNNAVYQTGPRFLIVGISALIASVITPDLWHNWEAILNNGNAYILSRTNETLPPDLTYPATVPFLILLFTTILLFLIHRKKLPAAHFFLVTGFGFMSGLMARNIPLFAIVATPVICELAVNSLRSIQAWTQMERRFAVFDSKTKTQVLPTLMILLTCGYFSYHFARTGESIYQFNPRVFPVQAADWLETNLQRGNMFNEFNWGGYLLFRFNGMQHVFVDSQSDFYGEPLLRDYEQIMTAQGDWQGKLETYRISWVIIPNNMPLTKALSESQKWRQVYQDNTAKIFQTP